MRSNVQPSGTDYGIMSLPYDGKTNTASTRKQIVTADYEDECYEEEIEDDEEDDGDLEEYDECEIQAPPAPQVKQNN